jgi:hypothetical protein
MKNLIPYDLFEMSKYDDSEVRSALEEFLYYLNDYDYDYKDEFNDIIENRYNVEINSKSSESRFKHSFNLKNRAQKNVSKAIDLLMDNKGNHTIFSYRIDDIYSEYNAIDFYGFTLSVFIQNFNGFTLIYYATDENGNKIKNKSDEQKILSIVEFSNPDKLVKRIIEKMKELL